MIKRRQVFVRARDVTGKWGSLDVLDLNAESFRVFVIATLFQHGLLTGIKSELVEGVPITLFARDDFRFADGQ